MSVTPLKTQTAELQEMYDAFKADYQKHLDITTEYENKFMNAFEDLCCFMTRGMRDLTGIIDKHIQSVSQIQQAHEENKFEEGNFNKVSLIKKQDTTIRQLEIKVAELESKLNNVNSPIAKPVATTSIEVTSVAPAESKTQCCARVGKAKYNISKQAAGFMDDFPAGTYTTKTGCVVGLACPNIITGYTGLTFCPDHNNGKFEDIRLEPGTQQSTVGTGATNAPETIPEPVADKKKPTAAKRTSKKAGTKTQEPEPATTQEPEPVISQPPEPVISQEPEPVISQEPEPLISQPPEPLISQPPEPVISQEPEPIIRQEPEPVISQEPEPATTQEPEPATTQEPEPAISQEPEPVISQSPEPVISQEPEPATTQETEPVISQEPEPVIAQGPEPVISQEPEPVISKEPVVITSKEDPVDMPVPSFDDIEFYDDPSGKTYYMDSKTRYIYEIAPNDEVGVFVKKLD